MGACICSQGNTNTGVLSCKGIMAVTRKLIVVQKFDSTGARNGIDVSGVTTLNQSYFDALINQTDVSKRIFPLPNIDNVDDPKGDPNTETLNSQEVLKISDGIRTFTSVMVLQAAKMVEVIEAMGCNDNAVYIIDKDGKWIGEMSEDGNTLYPVDVSQGTWDVRLMKTTDTTVQKIMLNFSFAPDVKDGRLNFILPSEMDNVDALTLDGLLDINAVDFTAIATATTVTLETLFGTALNKQKAVNLTAGDFVLYNNTTSAAVTIDSLVETSGTYVLAHAAGVTAADVLALSLDKDGYTRDSLGTVTVA